MAPLSFQAGVDSAQGLGLGLANLNPNPNPNMGPHLRRWRHKPTLNPSLTLTLNQPQP